MDTSYEQIIEKKQLCFTYYQKHFPFRFIFAWLKYGYDVSVLQRREFAFTAVTGAFIRYQPFTDLDFFKNTILKEKPLKIDIGPVYTLGFEEKGTEEFTPCLKELVFDIDISDYDDVRNCCKGSNMCDKCWVFMVVACRVLDAALKEDFGFKHVLWVYSGRRGVHCWVCDPKARLMPAPTRIAILNALTYVTEGANMPKKVYVEHPSASMSRAIRIIVSHLTLILEEQNILGSLDKVNTFLTFLGENEDLKESVKIAMMQKSTNMDRFRAFVETVQEKMKAGSLPQDSLIIPEIMLQLGYPRLDANVTRSVYHLLKCPFSIHPETGRVSLPFDPMLVGHMKPSEVPTIHDLLNNNETALQKFNCGKRVLNSMIGRLIVARKNMHEEPAIEPLRLAGYPPHV